MTVTCLALLGVLISTLAVTTGRALGANGLPLLPQYTVRGNPRLDESVAYLEDLVGALPAVVAGPFHLARTQGMDTQHNIVAFCIGDCPAAGPQPLGGGQSLTRSDVPDIAEVSSLSGATAARASGSEILVDAMHHAREAPGLRLLVELASQLASGYKAEHPEVVSLLASRAVWLVPAVNPDSYIMNAAAIEAGMSVDLAMRRKNQHRLDSTQLNCRGSGSSSDIGVDLNRNYDSGWTEADTFGKTPCDESFRGLKAGSERETAGMKLLVSARNFSVALNLHTFGKSINTPYATAAAGGGPRYAAEPTRGRIEAVAAGMAGALAAWDAHSWEWGPAVAMVGYAASGEAGDWMLDAEGVLAFAPELGPLFTDGQLPCAQASGHAGDVYAPCFWTPADDVTTIVGEALPLAWYALHATSALLAADASPGGAASVPWAGGAYGSAAADGACAAEQLRVTVRNAGALATAGRVAVAWVGGPAAEATLNASAAWSDAASASSGSLPSLAAVRSWLQLGAEAAADPAASPGRKRRRQRLLAAADRAGVTLDGEAEPLRAGRGLGDSAASAASRVVSLALQASTGALVPVDAEGRADDGTGMPGAVRVGVAELGAVGSASAAAASATVVLVRPGCDGSTHAEAGAQPSGSGPARAVRRRAQGAAGGAASAGVLAVIAPDDGLCLLYRVTLGDGAGAALDGPPLRVAPGKGPAGAACRLVAAAVSEAASPSDATLRAWGDLPPAATPTPTPSPGSSPSAAPTTTAAPAMTAAPTTTAAPTASVGPSAGPLPSQGDGEPAPAAPGWNTEGVTALSVATAVITGGCCLAVGIAVGVQMRRCGCAPLGEPSARRTGFRRVPQADTPAGTADPAALGAGAEAADDDDTAPPITGAGDPTQGAAAPFTDAPPPARSLGGSSLRGASASEGSSSAESDGVLLRDDDSEGAAPGAPV